MLISICPDKLAGEMDIAKDS